MGAGEDKLQFPAHEQVRKSRSGAVVLDFQKPRALGVLAAEGVQGLFGQVIEVPRDLRQHEIVQQHARFDAGDGQACSVLGGGECNCSRLPVGVVAVNSDRRLTAHGNFRLGEVLRRRNRRVKFAGAALLVDGLDFGSR